MRSWSRRGWNFFSRLAAESWVSRQNLPQIFTNSLPYAKTLIGLRDRRSEKNPAAPGPNCASDQQDLVQDNVTLPIQRLRESRQRVDQSDRGQKHRPGITRMQPPLADLREEVATFFSQSAEEYVYWVERAGKTQKNLALNARPDRRCGISTPSTLRSTRPS